MADAKIIVDGYNFLLAGKGTLPTETLWQSRKLVVNRLSSYAAMKKVKIVLVFDGRKGKHESAPSLPLGISLLFSCYPESADTLIKKLVEKEKQPARHVTVVTSDRAIAAYVKSCGCTHWTTEAFRGKMAVEPMPAEEEQKQSWLSRAELDEWLELFGEKKP
ncbi:NYN domain-containing protein [bacterium]|nr:NYN domain-containing protein [bacterium]